ncbi:MAG: hypothetical protein U1E39_10360 [Planctomycetota bacterium]
MAADLKPTSVRLDPADLERLEAIREAMAAASGLDAVSGVTKHQVLVAAVRAGFEVLERKLGVKPKRGRS